MIPYEVYALCSERSSELATRFLDAFLPNRSEVADEYPLPELSDAPVVTFFDAASLIRRLEADAREGYAIYWDRVDDGDPHQAILVFTEDGGMIAGVASARPDAAALLRELTGLVGADYGVVVAEERPPETAEEFVNMCRTTGGVRLVEGRQLG